MAKVKQKYIVRWLFEAKIYALTDFDDNIFYIGCTTKGLHERLIGHLSAVKVYGSWCNSRKDEKIRLLDGRVKIKPLESFAVFGKNKKEAQWNARLFEEKWIRKYLGEGVELCNCAFLNIRYKKGSKKIA